MYMKTVRKIDMPHIGNVFKEQRSPELPFLIWLDSSSIDSYEMFNPYPIMYRRCRKPSILAIATPDILYFRLNEQPSVNRAFPPVGWQLHVSISTYFLPCT
jgi:hypothetical protein